MAIGSSGCESCDRSEDGEYIISTRICGGHIYTSKHNHNFQYVNVTLLVFPDIAGNERFPDFQYEVHVNGIFIH